MLKPPNEDGTIHREETFSDLDQITQLAAIGTSEGLIHLIDAFTGKIVRDIQVHTHPIRFTPFSIFFIF
jgi:hypothetical protein